MDVAMGGERVSPLTEVTKMVHFFVVVFGIKGGTK